LRLRRPAHPTNLRGTQDPESDTAFRNLFAVDTVTDFEAARRFYQLGEFENVSICGSSTYPGGSVAGTPGYMCVSELLRSIGEPVLG